MSDHIEVEVANTRIWAHWCRANCKGHWNLKLGGQSDKYYFQNFQDAIMFQAEVTEHERLLNEILNG